MIDAISFAIFAGSRFHNISEKIKDTNESFYISYMLGSVANGMTWYRISHEMYGIMTGHECDLEIRERDYSRKIMVPVIHKIIWIIAIIVFIIITVIEVTVDFETYYKIDIMVTIMTIIAVVAFSGTWISENNNILNKGFPLLEHENVYYTIAILISSFGIILRTIYDDDLSSIYHIDWTIDLVCLWGQWFILVYSIPMSAYFRPVMIILCISQLMDAVYDEVIHYQHLYHVYSEGHELSKTTIAIAFLAWSIIEAYMITIQMHVSHIFTRKVKHIREEETYLNHL
jgi:hypothetical protein